MLEGLYFSTARKVPKGRPQEIVWLCMHKKTGNGMTVTRQNFHVQLFMFHVEREQSEFVHSNDVSTSHVLAESRDSFVLRLGAVVARYLTVTDKPANTVICNMVELCNARPAQVAPMPTSGMRIAPANVTYPYHSNITSIYCGFMINKRKIL